MNKLTMWLMTGIAAVVLTGCGANPTTPSSFKAVAKAPAKSAAASTAAKAPSVSTKTTPKPATQTQPKPAATPTPAPQAAADTGAIHLGVKVSGTAPVASLNIKLYEQANPAEAVEVPLTVANGAASWSQDEVPPGRYTIQVQALDASHKVLGLGNTEAIVTIGQTADVSLDLRVNTAGSTSGVSETEDTDTTTGGTQFPAPTQGGVIGLNIEIQ